MQVPVLSVRGIGIGSKTCVIVFLGLRSKIVDVILPFRERLMCSMKYEVCCVMLRGDRLELVFSPEIIFYG